MAIVSLDQVKNHARIDIEEDDGFLTMCIAAAEGYLKNATGKEYPDTDDTGNPPDYALEQIYILMLITYWYEHRSPAPAKTGQTEVTQELSYMTRSLLTQLQYK